MATEADIPAPICETRGEQGGNLVDQATNISINKLPQEEQIQADTHNGLPTVEGENFLRTPSIGEVHCEVKNNSPDVSKVTEKPDQKVKDDADILLLSPKLDDQPLEIDANEETSSEGIKLNAEESNGSDKDEDRDVVPVQYSTDSPVMTSETKVGDLLCDPDMDDVRVETQLSEDTTSDHHGTNDYFTEKVALSEEMLQVTNLPSEEAKEYNTPCISEGEDLNVQVKTTDDKTGDGKTTYEDISCNPTSDVSKEGECDQNYMTSEREELGNKGDFAENLDIAAEKASQENSTFTESITHGTSNIDELQSKDGLVTSFCEDISIQKGDRSVTTPEDSGILLENTLNESRGDVEYQSKTSEDTATNHSDPNLTEKSEESSFIQVECDEQLEEESEKLPLTEVSTGDTNDNVSAAIDKVRDEDEDLKKAELFENEQNTRSTLLKEDMQIENPAESLHVAPENIKASNLSQENNTKSTPEEQSTNANLHGNTRDNAEAETIDAVDTQREIFENFSTIVSSSPEEGSINAVPQEVMSDCTDKKIIDEVDTEKEVPEHLSTTVSNEDAERNSMIKLDGSENKNEEHLGKESEKTSSPLPLAREASDNESMFLQEARIENGEPKKDESCENEKSTKSMLLKIESKIEMPEDSLHDPEDIKAPDLGEVIETRSPVEEQSVTTHPQGILDEKTDDKTVDAAETKEETLENVPTIVPNEKTEENSLVEVDKTKMKNEEHLEKDSEQPPLIKNFTGNIVTDEVKIEDENPSRSELFEKEKNTESALLKEELQTEKPVESLHAALEDIKASDFGQNTETTGVLEEQSLNENPQVSLGDKTEEKTIDAANTNEKTRELQNVSNEDKDKDSLIQMDASELEHDTYLEEEMERPPLTEASAQDANDDESTILLEPKIGNECLRKVEFLDSEKNIDSTWLKKENLQDAPEDHKASASIEDIETTCSLEEQSLVMNEKTIDATDTKEVTLENVATKIPHEHTEENLVTQVDCSQMEHEEHLEIDSGNSSLAEAPTEETNADESKNIHEPKNRGKDSTKAELEDEKNTESASVKDEAQLEKPIDSMQAAPEDIKASVSSQDTNNSIEEQIPTANLQEISSDKTEKESVDAADTNEESLEDIATIIPDGDNENITPIEEDGSKRPSLKEASTENTDDEESTIMHEAEFVGESSIKGNWFANEKNTEGTFTKEEVSIESLQATAQDVKESALGQDRETSSLEEQSLTTNPQGIMDDNKEDKTNDTNGAEEETPEDKQNIAKTTPYDDTEENLIIQVDCSRLEQNEHLENDSENTSLTEAQIGDTKETILVKEEAQVEKPIDSLQVATEDITTSASCQETSSIEEQILTADPQEISCEKIEEKTIDAVYMKKETLEDVATNVPNGDNEDNSPIEVDGSQKSSLKEGLTGNATDDELTIIHEAKFADENIVKADLFENEKNIECALVKEEASVKPLQVANEDIKATASGQDRETSHLEEQGLTTNPQEIMGDHKEDKTIDVTDLKEETPEDKNVAIIIPHEDTEEDSLIQVDFSQMEQNEHLEKESENTSLTEVPTGYTIENNLKEEGQLDIDGVKASVSTQDTETSSTEAQVPTTNPQEISCYKTEGKSIDEYYMKEETLEDIATNISDGDNENNTPTKEDGSQKLSLKEASIRNANHESTITHEAKFEDESLIKVDLLKNEKNTEDTFVKEEASIESLQVATKDIKASTSGQDREILEEQSLSTNPQGIMGDNKEDKINDAIGVNEETPEDKNDATTSYEDTKENSPIQVDCSQLEQNEHSEKESESTSLTEAPTADITESTLVKEEPQVEDRIDSFQVATEDIKAFAPCQDTETSSTKEQILNVDPEDISSDKTIEETVDATDREETLEVQDIAKNVPHGDNEDNSPTEEDGSQKPSLKEASTGNANDQESTIIHEDEFVDESLIKADLFENEKNAEGTLIKEDVSIKSSQVAAEDIKASSSSEDRERNYLEEQILGANPGGLMDDNTENKTIDPTDLQKETPKDEVPEEIGNVDIDAITIQLKEEEGSLKDLQMTTAVHLAAHEEKGSIAETIPCTKDLDVNEDVVGNIAEDPNCKQEESSITQVSEEHMMTSNKNVPDVTSLASEVSELNNDHKVVGEANSCGDKTDTEKIEVLDDGSITIPTNETLAETDPRGSTKAEVQVSNGEKEAELMQQDPGAKTDQKDIEEGVLINDSQDVSEVNVEEEKTNSFNCKEISGSSNSEALEEVSSSNMALEEDSTVNCSQESRREIREEAENEEAQKQEEELHVSALVQDSSMEKIEKDVQLGLASANNSDISHEMQTLEEAPLPAPDENIIETRDCKESEVVGDATKNKYIEHLEQDDTTKSFLDDKKPTEREQEETEWRQEKVTLDKKVEITRSTSIPIANDFLPISLSETSKVDHSTTERELTTDREELHTGKTTCDNEETKIDKDKDDEEEANEQKTSDISPAAPNTIEARDQDVARLMSEVPEENFTGKYMTEANILSKKIDTTESTMINENTSLEGILVNNRSITDLETKIDDEAPESIETTRTATEGQDVERTSVGETSASISKCERDGYEHTYIGSMIEEKSDPKEVEFAPGENKSEYESKNQVLESTAQVQSCDIISKTEEENLEAAAEMKSGKVVAEDIFEQGETTYEKQIMKDNISSEKIKEEDKDVEDYHQGHCKEEVITETHLEDEVKQEEEINTEEIFEVIKNGNETEKVSKVSEEADDKASEEPEENLLANESNRSAHQKEQAKNVEEVTTILDTEEAHGIDIEYVKTGTQDSNKEINSSTAAFPEEDNRKGADDTDNEMAKDEGLLNQNSNISVIDAAAREPPKGLDENIICEAPPSNTVHNIIDDSKGKKEDANTIMMQQQEEHSKSKHEILPLPELAQGKENEKQNQKDEICSSDEVQAKVEENLMLSAGKSEVEANKADTLSKPNEDEDGETYVEAEKIDFSSHTKDISEVSINDGAQDIPKDNEDSTTKNKSCEEKYPISTESQISTVSEGIELIEQASKATRVTAEVQEPKAGINLGAAVPKATGVESRQVEEVSDKCKAMAETSTPEEPPMECTVGTSMEAEDQQIKLHHLPEELNIRDSEVKMAEKDDPVNLQNVRGISEDVQELNEGSFEVSNKENPVEADPDNNIETSEGQETEAIENAPVSETLKQETEEQKLGRTSENVSKAGVNCEEEKKINDKSNQLESSCSAEKEKASESNIHQSSIEDTAQNDKNQEGRRHIDSLPILPHEKSSDIEIADKDLPVPFAGLDGTDVTELAITPLPSKDKHVVLEADHKKNLNPGNPNGKKSISAECSQGEHEILKPSKFDQEEVQRGNEERTGQETREKSESEENDKPSLSDLLQVSMKETSQIHHSAIEKEPTTHKEGLQAEKTDEAEHEDAKTDEEKDDEEETSEQRRPDLSSEAPVMVDMVDADVKVAHKKSHNILSGVGSKVKHSIAKVKKVITGKSSHTKTPSPKKMIT